MEFTREQQLFQTIINKAWEDDSFKAELMTNPYKAIENLTGEKVQLPEGKQLVVRDQTNEEVIYINIPAEQKMDDVELNEEQLEAVAGGKGIRPTEGFIYGGPDLTIFTKPNYEGTPIIPISTGPDNSTI